MVSVGEATKRSAARLSGGRKRRRTCRFPVKGAGCSRPQSPHSSAGTSGESHGRLSGDPCGAAQSPAGGKTAARQESRGGWTLSNVVAVKVGAVGRDTVSALVASIAGFESRRGHSALHNQAECGPLFWEVVTGTITGTIFSVTKKPAENRGSSVPPRGVEPLSSG